MADLAHRCGYEDILVHLVLDQGLPVPASTRAAAHRARILRASSTEELTIALDTCLAGDATIAVEVITHADLRREREACAAALERRLALLKEGLGQLVAVAEKDLAAADAWRVGRAPSTVATKELEALRSAFVAARGVAPDASPDGGLVRNQIAVHGLHAALFGATGFPLTWLSLPPSARLAGLRLVPERMRTEEEAAAKQRQEEGARSRMVVELRESELQALSQWIRTEFTNTVELALAVKAERRRVKRNLRVAGLAAMLLDAGALAVVFSLGDAASTLNGSKITGDDFCGCFGCPAAAVMLVIAMLWPSGAEQKAEAEAAEACRRADVELDLLWKNVHVQIADVKRLNSAALLTFHANHGADLLEQVAVVRAKLGS